MSEFRSRDRITGDIPGETSVIWSNRGNAVIVFENYRFRGQWYLKLVEAVMPNRVSTDKPLEDLEFPEFKTLEAYQQAVDEWVAEPSNWFHRFDICEDDGYFYFISEHRDDEGEVSSSLPMRVRLADGQVATFKPCVQIKASYWFDTTNPGMDDEYLAEALKRYKTPPEIIALCNGIAAAMKAFAVPLSKEDATAQ